jgi:hypothetical protein
MPPRFCSSCVHIPPLLSWPYLKITIPYQIRQNASSRSLIGCRSMHGKSPSHTKSARTHRPDRRSDAVEYSVLTRRFIRDRVDRYQSGAMAASYAPCHMHWLLWVAMVHASTTTIVIPLGSVFMCCVIQIDATTSDDSIDRC